MGGYEDPGTRGGGEGGDLPDPHGLNHISGPSAVASGQQLKKCFPVRVAVPIRQPIKASIKINDLR